MAKAQEESGPSVRLALVGPTASGKTAVGIELAEILGGEIVSADSLQIYRRLNIGTAKPTAAEQARVRFHAIDVVEPDQDWSVVDHKDLCGEVFDQIRERGSTPIVAGGTGLYVKGLTTVLDVPAAPPDPEYRARMRTLAEVRGTDWIWSEVARVDPESAARLHKNDVGRLVRALEVYHATGSTLSELHARNRAAATPQPWLLFGLNFADRSLLYTRIDERVDSMMSLGFLDEVHGLLDAGYGRNLKPMQALGYRQMAAHIAGEMSLTEAIAEMKKETRQFAKRQLIWFRADRRIHWLEAENKSAAEIANDIAAAFGAHRSLDE